MTKLVVDDLRILNLEGDVVYARTLRKGIQALKDRKKWDEAWLDHDLGKPRHTIMPLIKYLEESMRNGEPIKIKQVYVITSNPVGAQRMKLALDKLGYSTTVLDPKPFMAGVISW